METMETDYSPPTGRYEKKHFPIECVVIQAVSYIFSSESEIESSTILNVDEVNRRIACIMHGIKNGSYAGFTKPIISKFNYKQDAATLHTTFGKPTIFKAAAKNITGVADLFNEFEGKYVVPRPIKMEKQVEDVKPNFGLMEPPFPQALRDMLASSIAVREADQSHEIPLQVHQTHQTPKQNKIKELKRAGPPIPLLGYPFKRRNIATAKTGVDFVITLSQKLLLQLVKRKHEKAKRLNDELNKLSELETDEVKIKVECFEDDEFDTKFQELSFQDFDGVFKSHLDDAVEQCIKIN